VGGWREVQTTVETMGVGVRGEIPNIIPSPPPRVLWWNDSDGGGRKMGVGGWRGVQVEGGKWGGGGRTSMHKKKSLLQFSIFRIEKLVRSFLDC
jgi:hypothetical protein